MTKLLFVKMKRADGALERLLRTVRDRGLEIVEMSARRSLDNSFYFVRISVQGSSSSELLREDIAALNEIRQVEIDGTGVQAAF